MTQRKARGAGMPPFPRFANSIVWPGATFVSVPSADGCCCSPQCGARWLKVRVCPRGCRAGPPVATALPLGTTAGPHISRFPCRLQGGGGR